MSVPVTLYFHDTRSAALAVIAMRNESFACDALNRKDDAANLRATADRLERATFRVRPFVFRSGGPQVESPAVTALVTEYRGA